MASPGLQNQPEPLGKEIKDVSSVELSSPVDDYESYRRGVLSRFTAEDDKRIMRKVDWHFLPLMALMYIVKQIDYINAASVKVLQVGQPTNIMKQLHMTADDYNWLQTLYFVSESILRLFRE